jgi:hypothetical protein
MLQHEDSAKVQEIRGGVFNELQLSSDYLWGHLDI